MTPVSRLVMLLLAIALAAPAHAIVVSGKITTFDGRPAAGADVKLTRQVSIVYAETLATATADANGAYAFSKPGVFGNIYVVAALAPYLETSVYGNTLDDTPQVRDVVLSMAGSITVTVRDAASRQPIANKVVYLFDGNGGTGSPTDAQGRATWSQQAGGPYRVCVLDDSDEYRNECQGDQHVGLPFDPATPAPLMLGSGEDKQVVIDLDPGAGITGAVTDRYFGTPASGPLYVELFDPAGASLALVEALADSNGHYAVRGLPAGNYRLRASGRRENHYSARVYPDVDCALDCDVTAGALVAVSDLRTTPGVDFALHPGAVALGTLNDRATGAPIANAEVVAYEQLVFGAWGAVAQARTDASGHFALAHLHASAPTRLGSGATDHINASWPDTVCYGPPCADGDPITFGVDEVRDGFSFSLDRGGSIRGSVVGESSGLPVPSVVIVQNADMTVTWHAYLDGSSAGYQSYGLPPGTYYAAAQFLGVDDLVCEIYAERTCESFGALDPANATPIVISGADVVEHVDFTLDDRRFVSGFE